MTQCLRNIVSSQRSERALHFLTRFVIVRSSVRRGHQHKVCEGKKYKKVEYSHPRSPGICNLRPRRCICKFIRPRRPIGICLCSTPATVRRPMGGESSRGSTAIDPNTWILVCALARVLPLFRSNTTLPAPPPFIFFFLAALLRSILTGETG